MKQELIQATSILVELLHEVDPTLNKAVILQHIMAVAPPPVQTAAVVPPPGVVAPPPVQTAAVVPPPPENPSVHVMTPAAGGASYEAMIAANWTDETLIQQGMMMPPGGVVPGFIQQPSV